MVLDSLWMAQVERFCRAVALCLRRLLFGGPLSVEDTLLLGVLVTAGWIGMAVFLFYELRGR